MKLGSYVVFDDCSLVVVFILKSFQLLRQQFLRFRGHIYFVDTRMPNTNPYARVNYLVEPSKPQKSTSDGIREVVALQPLQTLLRNKAPL